MLPIYLDYNATTPIAKEVKFAMLPLLDDFYANPSSSHFLGSIAKTVVDNSHKDVAALLGCDPEEIIFTSGGTESNNHAIRGYCYQNRRKGNHIITSAIEHPSVLEVCLELEREGFDLTVLPVDSFGQVMPEDLEKEIRPDTILITIMHANNEVGTIQRIPELTRIARKYGIAFHTDAAQSVGKIPVLVDELGVDMLSVAGHKLYAPKGIGALYVREGIEIKNLMFGAGHERGRRPGTENVLEIAGFGEACKLINENLRKYQRHYQKMKDFLFASLKIALGENNIRLNGHPTECLPNTLSVGFLEVNAHDLIVKIGNEVAVSAGSACHADLVTISSVLKALHVPDKWAQGTVRFSVGRETTRDQITQAVALIKEAM